MTRIKMTRIGRDPRSIPSVVATRDPHLTGRHGPGLTEARIDDGEVIRLQVNDFDV